MNTALDVSALMEALDGPRVLSLAVHDGAEVSATPLFYARGGSPEGAGPLLWVASAPATHHGQMLGSRRTRVAASLYEDPGTIRELRGVQLWGEIRRQDVLPPGLVAEGRAIYLATHPGAEAFLGPATSPPTSPSAPHLYALAIARAKLTDNARLGPGQHAEWTFPGAFETMDPG